MSHPNYNSFNPSEPEVAYGVDDAGIVKKSRRFNTDEERQNMREYGFHYISEFNGPKATAANEETFVFKTSKIGGLPKQKLDHLAIELERKKGALEGYKVPRQREQSSKFGEYRSSRQLHGISQDMIDQVGAEAQFGYRKMDNAVYNSLKRPRTKVGGIQAGRNTGLERYENKSINPEIRTGLPDDVPEYTHQHDEIRMNRVGVLPLLSGGAARD